MQSEFCGSSTRTEIGHHVNAKCQDKFFCANMQDCRLARVNIQAQTFCLGPTVPVGGIPSMWDMLFYCQITVENGGDTFYLDGKRFLFGDKKKESLLWMTVRVS